MVWYIYRDRQLGLDKNDEGMGNRGIGRTVNPRRDRKDEETTQKISAKLRRVALSFLSGRGASIVRQA